MVVVEVLVKRGRIYNLFCNVMRILADSLAWSLASAEDEGQVSEDRQNHTYPVNQEFLESAVQSGSEGIGSVDTENVGGYKYIFSWDIQPLGTVG